MRKALLPAFLLIVGSVILGATVLREPLARASAPLTSVIVANTAGNPVPVTVPNTDSSGNIKVHEQGIASVAQSGNWNVGLTGVPAVKSGDVATVLAQGSHVAVSAGSKLTLNPDASDQDVGAYREVTLYLAFVGGSFYSNTQLASLTNDGSPFLFAFDDLSPQDFRLVKTYDPAPATLVLQLINSGTTDTEIDYTLIGRTN